MLEKILNFIFPPKCIICGEVLGSVTYIYICAACFENLEFNSAKFSKIDSKNIRYNYMDGIFSLSAYSGKLKKSLHRYKFNNKPQYFRTYGRLLAEQLKKTEELKEIDIIAAIPLHKNRERNRGYNQSALVSRAVSRETGIAYKSRTLRRVRDTATQRLFSKDERQYNVQKAFVVVKPHEIKEKNILLIDDILTTGSTMNECSRVLKECGARKVYGVVMASGRKELESKEWVCT